MSKEMKAKVDEVFNAKGGARYVGLSDPTFRKHLSEIAHRRAGRRILIRKAALDAWLEGYGPGGSK